MLFFLTFTRALSCDQALALNTAENDQGIVRQKSTSHITIEMNMPRQNAQGSAIGVPLLIDDNTGSPRYAFLTWYHHVCTPHENIWTLKITCRDVASIQKGGAQGDPYGGQTPLVISFDGQGNPKSFDGLPHMAPPVFITWYQTTVGPASQVISLDLSRVTSQDAPYKHPRIDYNLSE
ncbi:MAG: hypothetical protein C0514_02525 [Candidatus Puniceispirillum sp.]|nr:hypothetical protein [Candidatus Puniceispirillum sp.]